MPDPQDPETFTRSKLDWSELVAGAARAAARRAPVAAGAAPGAPRPGRPRPVGGRRSTGTTPTAGWSCTAARCGWWSTWPTEPREIDLDRAADEVLFATGELPALDGETRDAAAGERGRAQHPLTCAACCPRPAGGPGRRRPGRGLPAAGRPVAADGLRRLARRRRSPSTGAAPGWAPPATSGCSGCCARWPTSCSSAPGRRPPRGTGRCAADSAVGRLRASLGRPATLPIAVVSPARPRSTPVGAGRGRRRTLVVTCAAADAGRRAALAAAGATVLVCGDDDVDLPAAVDRAGRAGAGAGDVRGWAAAARTRRWPPGWSTSWTSRSRPRWWRRRSGCCPTACRRRSALELRQLLEEDGVLFTRYRVAGARSRARTAAGDFRCRKSPAARRRGDHVSGSAGPGAPSPDRVAGLPPRGRRPARRSSRPRSRCA